jgi:transposase
LAGIAAKLMARDKADLRSRLLATIPAVGPIGAVSSAIKGPDATVFRSGWHFAAWLGITPREHSTAGWQRFGLGRISREGGETLRQLLVLGATAVIQQASRRPTPRRQATACPLAAAIAGAQAEEAGGGRAGQQSLPRRRPGMTRIIWAMLVSGAAYRRPQAAGSFSVPA